VDLKETCFLGVRPCAEDNILRRESARRKPSRLPAAWGFRLSAFGFRDLDLGSRVWDVGFRDSGFGFVVKGSELGVKAYGLGVRGEESGFGA
jgi:hypothetical protein